MIRVQTVLAGMARAFREPPASLVDRIQRWEREHGREAALSSEAYHNLKIKKGQAAHFQTAILFLEFLVANWSSVKNRTAARRVRAILSSDVASSRKRRFERDMGHDSKSDSVSIDHFSGAYALCRIQSQTNLPCQELLILSPAKGRERTRYATYVSHNLIVRGRWHLLGPALYVEGVGYRAGHKPDFMSLSLPCREDINALGGLLIGLATANRDVVTMAAFAIRIDQIDESLFAIGDRSDAEIIEQFTRAVPAELPATRWKRFEAAHKRLNENNPDYRARLSQANWFSPKFINAADPFVTHISGIAELARHVILPGIRTFCRRKW
jgi:hypothetical protein